MERVLKDILSTLEINHELLVHDILYQSGERQVMTTTQWSIEPIPKVQYIHNSINGVMQGINQAKTLIIGIQPNLYEIDQEINKLQSKRMNRFKLFIKRGTVPIK